MGLVSRLVFHFVLRQKSHNLGTTTPNATEKTPLQSLEKPPNHGSIFSSNGSKTLGFKRPSVRHCPVLVAEIWPLKWTS
jgi:hypothetical protein